MSLTRVWMSCRHRGHVSSCKAHCIHIPLWEDEGRKETDCNLSSLKTAAGPARKKSHDIISVTEGSDVHHTFTSRLKELQ